MMDFYQDGNAYWQYVRIKMNMIELYDSLIGFFDTPEIIHF